MNNEKPINTSANQENPIPTEPAVAPETKVIKQPVVAQTPQPPTPSADTPNPPNKSKKLGIIFIILVVIIFLAIAGYFLFQNYILKDHALDETMPTPTPITESEKPKINLIYYKDGELWLINTDEETKKITNTNKSIYGYSYNPDGRIVAFITGENIANENNYTYVQPTTVYYYSLDTEKTEQIYFLEPTIYENTDYSVRLGGIGVSEDNNLIPISTSDSLYIYNIQTKETKNIFSFPVNITGNPQKISVWLYSQPIVSPNNNNLVLRKNFYEGYESILVDLKTNEITDLPFGGYGSGNAIFGWKDENSLLIHEFNMPDAYYSQESRIMSSPLENPKQTTNLATIEGDIRSAVFHEDKAYVISVINRPNSGDHIPESIRPLAERYHNIFEVDLNTGDYKKLHEAKEEQMIVGAPTVRYNWLQISADGKTLYIDTQAGIYEGPTKLIPSSISFIELDNPTEPKELVNNASLFVFHN